MSSLVDIFIVLLIAHWNFETVAPKRVSILDTSEKSSLRWATWSNINNESRDDGTGWLEESVAHIHEGTNSRSYVTCDVAKDNVDNWLRLNFVPRGGARRLSIELKFTIRDCKRFPRTARTCKETFSLLYYETDDAPYDPGQGPKNATLFRSIDRITADSGRFSEKGTAEENVEVRTVAVTKRGVYFALRDEGACVSLLNVRIFYDVCEEVNVNFAWFPETAVGPSLTSIQEALGHCVTNASPPSGAQPKYVCKADGSWDLLSGGCQCNPGFRSDSQRCVACDIGTFKDSPGFGACQSCPDHSRALSTGSAICSCEAGYYRAISDLKSASCTRPPSRPENPQLVSVDTTSAVITWTRPSNLGGRSELWYTIVCQLCPSNVKYYPAKTKFNATKIILTNLDPSSTYTVFIYAENEVSSQIDSLPMYAVVEASTKHLSPMQISNFRIDSISENQIALSWDAPAILSSIDNGNNGGGIFFAEYDNVAIGGGDSATKRRFTSGVVSDLESGRTMASSSSSSIQYQIKIYAKDASSSNVTFKTTIEPKVTVRGLSENVEYVFEVRPFVSPVGFGTWSDPKIVRTTARNELTLSPPVANSPSTRKPVLIALCVFGVVAGVLFCVAVYLIWRRKRQNLHNRHSSKHKCSDLDALNYGDSVPTADYNASAATLNRKLTSSVPVVFNGINCKPYIDPTTYEDPCQALRDFANEIDENDVTIEDIIGAGEFGEVCKGKLRMCSGGVFCIPVAIKTLKTGSSEKAKLDFLTEASIMGQFNHPNVVKLKGVVTKCEPMMIITEYMDNGSLDNFLRVNDGKFNAVQLVSMLRGTALGMKYLSEKCYVHRDLAARNVLVDAQLTCKIADFGLSRTLDGCFDHAYTTKGGKIPIRWTAPEAITYRKFTSASDVWSYGIVMWEVMSFGERPYGDWANQDVIQHVEQGYRLPPPMDCPTSLHRLMLECWNRDRQLRPTFASIVFTLSNYLHCPELLYAVSSSNSNSLAVQALIHQQNASASNLYQPNSTQLLMMKAAGVDDFLRQIGLYEKYAVTFRHHGVKSALALSRLNRNDFSTWGVKREDQEKIFDALHYLQLHDRRRSVVDCRPVDRPNAKTAAADSIAGRRVSVFGDSDLSFLS